MLFSVAITDAAVAACASNEIDVTGKGSQCVASKFELTTTNLSANASFTIWTSAKGTFYIDCGDGGTLSGANLSGFIPSATFAGLVANSSPTATSMWTDTFNGTQLVTSCPSGTVQYTTQYESNWDGKVSCNCTGANYYDGTSGTCTACPAGYTSNTNNGKTDASQCQISCAAGTYVATPATVGSTAYTRLEYIENPNGKYINTGFTHSSNATTNACLWSCGAGYYSTDNTSCTAVGGGYYYAVGDNTRSACAAGLTTVGYGHGADEADDCGHELHLGGFVFYTKQTKPTTPALNITDGLVTSYLGVSATDQSLSKLHLHNGTQQYTAYDDSLLYGERSSTTGVPITP